MNSEIPIPIPIPRYFAIPIPKNHGYSLFTSAYAWRPSLIYRTPSDVIYSQFQTIVSLSCLNSKFWLVVDRAVEFHITRGPFPYMLLKDFRHRFSKLMSILTINLLTLVVYSIGLLKTYNKMYPNLSSDFLFLESEQN